MVRGPVYLVDDDDSVRESIRMLLELVDHEVVAFARATDFLHTEPANAGCVITDLRMPEMDGFELQRRLRETGCTLPVILMTGLGSESVHQEARSKGIVDVLEKPFNAATLFSAIERAFTHDGSV